jgi:magnesium and cobalt exporter, CNNM family
MSLTTVGLELLLIVVVVLINALFVAAELALVTARRTRMEQLANAGSRRASLVRAAMERPVTFIAGTQVGITVASLVLGWIGEPTIARLLEPLFEALPALHTILPGSVIALVVTALSFFVITFFHITFGEIVPKSVALFQPERVAQWVVPPVLLFARLAHPLIVLVNGVAEGMLRLFGLHASTGRHSVHSEEEIRALIAESRQAGLVGAEEEELVRRVFRFGDRLAREVMVPRTRVVALSSGASLNEVVAAVRTAGYSRLPVYDGNLDNIVGVVTAKAVLAALGESRSELTASGLMRPAYYIPDSKELHELLPELRAQETQLAVVLDEYGGTAGILTIEDLIEEVVGEIVSEYGVERRFIHRQTDQELLVEAELNLDDLNEIWDLELPTDEVDTVGGFVYQQLGHIPAVGEGFTHDDLAFSVRSMRGRAIGAVRITHLEHDGRPAPDDEADPSE